MNTLERRLQDATTTAQVRAVLRDIQRERREKHAELEKLTDAATDKRERQTQQLAVLQTQLSTTGLTQSRQLMGMLGSAGSAAGRIASGVRQVDRERQRVREALQYVQDVISLKNSIVGMQDAMAAQDWDRAARYVSEARALPQQLVAGEFAKKMVPVAEIPDFPEETIAQACESLGKLFLREFHRAAAAKDMAALTRFFKLFPLIGKDNQGLQVYSQFIAGIITTQSRALMQQRPPEGQALLLFYSRIVSRLFEDIATIVDQHSTVIEAHYGRPAMVWVIDKIQDEADLQGGIAIDTFWDENRVEKLLSDVRAYAYNYLVSTFSLGGSGTMGGSSQGTRSRVNSPAPGTAGSARESIDEQGTDLKSVGSVVNEMSIMLNRWSLYRRFLQTRWGSVADGESEKGPTDVDRIIAESGFARKVSTLLAPGFETFSTFVLRRSVEKAFQLEELPNLRADFTAEAPLVASFVDDVMYIFSTVLKQALASGEPQVVKTVLGNTRRILESDYIGMVQRKLRDEAPRPASQPKTQQLPSSRQLAGLTGPDEDRLRRFILYLNSLSLSADYAERIVGSLDVDADLGADTPAADDAKKVLTSLAASVRVRCNELISDSLQVLFTTVLNVRVRNLCTGLFRDANYMLSPNDVSDLSESFAQRWKALIAEFVRIMSPDTFSKLLGIVTTSMARLFEKWIWSLEGKVNDLGAIALDRDISRIIGTVSEGHYRLRDRFVRVAQIVMIAGLDDPEEEAAMDIVLSDEERARARTIRVERR